MRSFFTFSSWKSLPEESLYKSFWFWGIRFLLSAATVLFMTLLLSYFIAHYHTPKLPLLFFGVALGSFLGTLFTQFLLRKFSSTQLLTGLGFLLSNLLLIVFFIQSHFLIFYISILSIFSIGIIQFNILLSISIEKAFSPIESEGAFPIIESAEPIGGVFAGALAFLGASYLSPKSLLLIVAGLLFCISIILFFRKWESQYLYSIEPLSHTKEKSITISSSWEIIKNTPLLQMLFLFVFLQSFGYVLVEVLYSMAASAVFSGHENSQPAYVIAQELTHGIGIFHITTYGLLIIIQIFFASRIQHSLGVIKSIFIQPTALILMGIVSLFSGSFLFGLGIKSVYEIFGGISKNSYHSSFYSFPHQIRENAKELLDGFARPVGMLMSSVFLMIISGSAYILKWNFIGFYIFCSISIIIISALSFLLFCSLRKGYTQLAVDNIQKKEVEEKFDAIEILSQSGHNSIINILSHVLRNKNEDKIIKIKILKAFGMLEDNNSLPDLLWALSHNDKEIQFAGVKALGNFSSLKKDFISQIFSRHKIIKELQKVFLHANSKKLRFAVITVFQELKHPEIVSFLVKALQSENKEIVFCAILGCSSFHDISTAYYLFPLLKSNDEFIKSATIIALWQFPRYRKACKKALHEMISSDNEKMKKSGVYSFGEINDKRYIHTIQKILEKNQFAHNTDLEKHCFIALVKLGNNEYIPNVLEMISHKDEDISSSTKKILFSPNIEKKLQHHIKSFIKKEVVKKIHSIFKKQKHSNIEKFKDTVLEDLHYLYGLIEKEKSVWKMKKLLNQKNK